MLAGPTLTHCTLCLPATSFRARNRAGAALPVGQIGGKRWECRRGSRSAREGQRRGTVTMQRYATNPHVQEQTYRRATGSLATHALRHPLSRTGRGHRRQTLARSRLPPTASRCRQKRSFCLKALHQSGRRGVKRAVNRVTARVGFGISGGITASGGRGRWSACRSR